MGDAILRNRPVRQECSSNKLDRADEADVQRYLAAGAARGAKTPAHPALNCIPVVLAVVLAAVILRFIGSDTVQPRIWTKEELAKHDGSSKKHPLLLSILGSVFDVAKGFEHYGPGRPYHHFVGRDGSRAFVSGDFSGDGLTDSLEGLTPAQIKGIDDWKGFYHKNYRFVGKLVGQFYDSQGHPTIALQEVEKQAALGREILKKQEVEEQSFNSCNSRWTSTEGSQMWCASGYPRKVDRTSQGLYKGPSAKRCACFQADELNRPDLELYEGCDALATTCKAQVRDASYWGPLEGECQAGMNRSPGGLV